MTKTTKTILALSFTLSLPAFAHGNGDAACAPAAKVRSHQGQTGPSRQTGTSAHYTPGQNNAAPTPQAKAAEGSDNQRASWWRRHSITMPFEGSLPRTPHDSAIGYLHGTDDPHGRYYLRSDEGPSAERDHSTASRPTDADF